MRKVLLSLSLFCAATTASMAMKVTGKVTDDSGALPGASVMIKGTNEGVETDDDGNFSIEASQGQTLVVEYLGYEPKEIKVGKQAKLGKISLAEEEGETLAAITVVSQPYGGQGGVTGATTTIGADALKGSAAASVDNALQGRVSGVQVATTSGQPGSSASVRIHGASSFGNSDPLYVVDGMPIGGAGGVNASSNPLASINPADIESMEVLKDAAATAIYGSRAANGVIIITTKKGKSGDAKITYSGNFTVSQFTNRYDMMNLREYASYQKEDAIVQDRQTSADSYYANPSLLGEGTNWQDELFQTAIGHSHQLSVNGGSDKTQYNISLGYTNSEGVIITSEYERINGRISVESQVKDWLKMGMNIGLSRQNSVKIAKIIDPKAADGASVLNFKETDENILVQTMMQLPSDSPYNLDGTVSGPETDLGVKMNPIAELRQSPLERTETNIIGTSFLEFKLMKDLTWRNELGVDMTTASDHYFQPSYSYGGLNKGTDQATLDEGNYANNSVRFSSYLNYNHTFAKAHKMNVTVGAESNYYNWEGTTSQGVGYATNAIPTLNMASDAYVQNFYGGHGAMASFFGRVNYDYLGKYYASATCRFDGDSRFADGNRWGMFPGASLAWRVSGESFIEDSEVKNTITDLKLRLTYGSTGNSNCQSGHIAYLSKWNSVNSDYDLFHYYNYTNPDLIWETNKQATVGVNLSLWNRVDFTLDGFYKVNEDLLLKPQLPSYVAPTDGGWTYINTAYINAGSIKNTGFDLEVHSVNIDDSLLNKPFTWDMNLSFSFVRNEVVDLGSSTEALTEKSDPNGSYRMFNTDIEINRSIKGEAPGRFYGYKTMGLIQNDAILAQYKALTGRAANVGDVLYSTEKSYIGDPNPDFTYGFGTNLSWGQWSLNLQLAGSQGNDVYNLIRQRLEAQSAINKYCNLSKECLNFARIAKDANGQNYIVNANTSIPRSEFTNDANGNDKTTSDRYVEDGSYLKIQNIGVTYSLPGDLCKKIKLDNLHVSAGVSNVYTFTGYSGYDPENPGSPLRQGVDEGRYPSPRVYNVGLGFNF